MHDPAPRPPAVLLLSGGLDSTTLLALARREGFAVHALTFRYGQRHAHEIEAARRVARAWGAARHEVVDIDLRTFGGSALTTDDTPVPKDRPAEALAGSGAGIPVTYVPARNTIFLSFALAWAEVLGAADIFIGVNALDYSGYPDCRPEFVEAFERMANLATAAAVEGRTRLTIRAPLLHLTKREIIALGTSLGVDYAQTTSCYDPAPDGAACGHCDACQLRLRGFAEGGMVDPARYSASASAPATLTGDGGARREA
jgi:7-cyano-7-deazaguanine synthase